MPGSTPNVAKAQAWNWLMEELELLHQVHRDGSRDTLAAWLHFGLDRASEKQTIPPDSIALLRHAADLLGGIANVPDALKTILRTGLQDEWSARIAPTPPEQDDPE